MNASTARLIRKACTKAGIDARSVKTTWARLSARDKADMRRDMELFVSDGPGTAFGEFVRWSKDRVDHAENQRRIDECAAAGIDLDGFRRAIAPPRNYASTVDASAFAPEGFKVGPPATQEQIAAAVGPEIMAIANKPTTGGACVVTAVDREAGTVTLGAAEECMCGGIRGWYPEIVPGTEDDYIPDSRERYCDCEAGRKRMESGT